MYPLPKIASIFEDALVKLYCRGIQATSVFESKITQKCFQEMSHFYLCVVNDIRVIEKVFLLQIFSKNITQKSHCVVFKKISITYLFDIMLSF